LTLANPARVAQPGLVKPQPSSQRPQLQRHGAHEGDHGSHRMQRPENLADEKGTE
jgi:hypothetical protein